MPRAFSPRSFGAALLALSSFASNAADLTVSAAASLTNAFRELGPLFEAQHPGTQVVFNFAASDALLAQIERGAPADVFASADQEAMDRAATQRSIVAGTRRNFVANTLVMIVPAAKAAAGTPGSNRAGNLAGAPSRAPGLKSLADLGRPEVERIAIGNPAGVPAGRYTRAALEAARLWGTVEPKAVMAQSVRQALDYVARGEVEAGFVYATDALVLKDKVTVAVVVPTETPITYPIAVVAGGPNPDARAFVDFVVTPAAQAVFARHGFGKP